MKEVFDNESIRYILRTRHRDYVPTVELRHRLCPLSTPALPVQRRLLWFDHATLTAEIAASEAKSIEVKVGFDAQNRSGFGAGRGFTDQIHNLPRRLERIGSSSKQQFNSMLLSSLRSTPWTETTL